MKEEHCARARGFNLPISTKQSIEICNFIRYKGLEKARKQLKLVLEKKLAIPLNRFHKDRGHRKGKIGPGFFPEKATKEIINLLNTLESNAVNNGLNVDNLILKEIIANKGSISLRHGRRRVSSKSTHIEVTAEEGERESQKNKK